METTTAIPSGAVFCRDIFTENQCLSLLITRIVMAVLGILGSLFLIFMMWVTHKLKMLFYRILLFISICNIIRNIAVIIQEDGTPHGHALCIIQAVLIQFFTWAIILWELGLTVHLFLTSANIEVRSELFYHAPCWICSVIFTVIPLAASKYGHAITWCWIEDAGWRIGMLYSEYMLIIVVIFVLYGKVYYSVYAARVYARQSAHQQQQIKRLRDEIKFMMKYPLVILAEGILPVSFRFYNLSKSDEEPSFVFSLLFVVGVILWGIPFVAVYVLDPPTRGEICNLRAHFHDRLHRIRTSEQTSNQRPPGVDSGAYLRDEREPSRISIEQTTVF